MTQNSGTETVYDLWFIREYESREDTELHIGIFATSEDAASAIALLRDKPGFRDFPEGFEIHETILGQVGWPEGFRTAFGAPPKDALEKAFDLPAWLEDKPE